MKAKITISRDSTDQIRISINDEESRELVARLTLSLADFASAVTGLAFVSGDVQYGKLENVGKRKVIERRRIHVPGLGYSRTEAEDWLRVNAQEDGWHLDCSLRSQDSIVTQASDGATLNYSVFRYVETDGSEA